MNQEQYDEIRSALARIESRIRQIAKHVQGQETEKEISGGVMTTERELTVGSKVYATEETPYSVKGEWGVVIHVTDSYVRVIYANGGLVVYAREGINKHIENSGLIVEELRDYVWVNFARTMEDWRNKVFDVAVLPPRLT